MSKRVRLIMGLSAVFLMGILLTLIAVQNFLYKEPSETQIAQTIPALGPISARPAVYDFKVLDSQNKPLSISSLKGRVLHINFWASWCAPCLVELPLMENLQKAMGAEKYIPILVNVDHSDEARQDAEKLQQRLAPTAIKRYVDTKSLSDQFKVEALPYHLLIDKEGRIAAAFYAPLDKNMDVFISTLEELNLEIGAR